MTTLTEQQINNYYTDAGLTPILVVLGGGQSYGMPDAADHDYFGYHVEDRWADDVNGSPVMYSDTTTSFTSYPIARITPALEGDEGPQRAMYTIDNWLYHQVIISNDPQYTNIKNQILAAKDEDWMRYYAHTAFTLFRQWRASPSDIKIRNRAVRIALTVKYYIAQETLECDWNTLTTEYPISTDEARTALKRELRPIFLNIIADRISWEMIR